MMYVIGGEHLHYTAPALGTPAPGQVTESREG